MMGYIPTIHEDKFNGYGFRPMDPSTILSSIIEKDDVVLQSVDHTLDMIKN